MKQINRLEVIDMNEQKTVYQLWNKEYSKELGKNIIIEYQMQDNEKTLKVWFKKND